MSDNEHDNEKRDSVSDLIEYIRKTGKEWLADKGMTKTECLGLIVLQIANRLESAWKRERDLIRSCARWILAHDIYGHMSKELLAECKNVLGDDGQFLNK